MSLYEVLKFIHVLMAVVWVGGGIAIQVFAFRATHSKDPDRKSTRLNSSHIQKSRMPSSA